MWENLREECGNDAENISHTHAEADQRKHVEAAVNDGVPGTHKKRPATPNYYRSSKQQRNPGRSSRAHKCLERIARNELTHPEDKNRQRQNRTDPEATLHVYEFRVLFLYGDGAGLERHPTNRTKTRRITHNLRMHWAGVFDLLLRRAYRSWLESHTAFRTSAGFLLSHFRMHRARVFAGSAC